MLENWLSPLTVNEFTPTKSYSRSQFGRKIIFHWKTIPSLERVQIAIIGLDQKDANAIRKELYKLEFPFRSFRVADLGNIRNKNHSFLIPVIKELLDSNIVPLILGRDIDHSVAHYQSYHLRKYVNLTVVDEKIRLNTSKNEKKDGFYLNSLIKKKSPSLFNLGVLGYQSHFTSSKAVSDLTNANQELVRLGEIRNDITETEPLIRYADLLTFNISVLKSLEAPAQADPSPSGLFSEEACQLCRYAGLSDRLTSIGFYGYHHEKDPQLQTAKTIAQLIWYFMEGVKNRKKDYPVSSQSLIEYIVENKNRDHQLHFWKSNKSGRWWIEIPLKGKGKRTEMVPCSYEDYKAACQDEMTSRLIRAFQKLS